MNPIARRALHSCKVPKDLSTVTHRDAAGEKPEAVGVDTRTVDTIWKSVEALYRTGVHPGIQISVRHRGEQILHRAIGHASGNGPQDPAGTPKVAMTTETPICYF
jgi:hypothetical protein